MSYFKESPSENRKHPSIYVENNFERESEVNNQRQPSQNSTPNTQQTFSKPPSGSQTLPTPRKFQSHDESLRKRHDRETNVIIQLPFGGGKEFENIEAELQV